MRAVLPARGVSAHRGGAEHRPENTLAAFRHCVALGVHQVELDLRRTRDGALVLIHDASVDRTSDGSGVVAELSLSQLLTLDFGRCRDAHFAGERIPTFEQVLAVLPADVWINVQIKLGEPIAREVARQVVASGRVGQVVVAGGRRALREAREVDPALHVCNLARGPSRSDYVDDTLSLGADFIQFHHLRGLPERVLVEKAHAGGLRINYVCAPDGSDAGPALAAGADFVLVDDVAMALQAAAELGIDPVVREVEAP